MRRHHSRFVKNSFLNVCLCGTEKYCEMLKRVIGLRRLNVCKFPAVFVDTCTTFGVKSKIMPYDT